MRFLDAGRVLPRHDQFDLGRAFGEPAIPAEQSNAHHAPAPRFFDRGQHIAGFARAGNADEHVAGLTEGADLPRESVTKFVVVAYGGEQPTIDTQGERGIRTAVTDKAADKLGGDMRRVGGTAAVAAKHQFVTRDQGGSDRIGGADQRFFEWNKRVEGGTCRLERPPVMRHDPDLPNPMGANFFIENEHLDDRCGEARQFPPGPPPFDIGGQTFFDQPMPSRSGLFVAALLLASCTTPPKAVDLVDAPVLPLALDGDFTFRKIHRFLNQPELFQTTQNESINFERTRVNFGTLSADERRQRQGTYFDFFWRANRPADVTVRLEYRQAKTGNAVRAQAIGYEQAKGSVKTSFAVIGDNHLWNGPVTAWRCLLIENDRIVGFTQSYLWK